MNFASVLTGFRNTHLTRKLLWLLILTTLCAVVLLIIPRVPTQRPAIDSKLLTLRVMLCAVFLASIINWKQLTIVSWRFIDYVFCGLLIAFISALLFSGNIMYSMTESWQLGGLIGVSWIISRISPTVEESKALLRVAGVLGILASLYGFLTYVGMDILRPLYPFDFEETQAGGRNYIHSFFGNPEYFGGFAAPTAVIVWGLAFQPRLKLLWRLVLAAGTAFILLVLALSGSRGAFLGFLAGAAIVFLGQVSLLAPAVKKASWLLLSGALLVLALAALILSTPNPLNPRDMRLIQRFTSLSDTQTASVRERALFYTSTAAAIPENPVFGYGPGTYRLYFLENVKRLVDADERAGTVVMLQELNRRLAEHAHNDYLEIWFEQGTLGISAFFLLLTYGGVAFARRRLYFRQGAASARQIDTLGVYVTTFAGVTTVCINAATSFPFHMPARATLVWLLIGAFFALDQQLNEAPKAATGITPGTISPTKDEN